MLIDHLKDPQWTSPPAATVIVGSGAAGLVLAEELSAAGRPVVLLESGPDLGADSDGAVDVADLNTGVNVGLRYSGLSDGRSRNLGGTTQLWHGQCMRLHDIDVADRPWIARSGWPIELAELDSHYPRAERWLGVTGGGYGAERWDEHPRLAPIEWNRELLLHDFTEYTPKPMLGREHRARLVADPRITVVVNATVGRLLLDGDRAVGVRLLAPERPHRDVEAAQVVLCAGAIENARLLQLSDPDGVGLGTGRQHTGRYLQDHPIIRTAEVISGDHRVLQDRYIALHRGNRRLFPKVRLSPDAQREYGLVDATAVFVHEHADPGLAAARRLLTAMRARRRPKHPVRDSARAMTAASSVLRDTYRRYATGRSTGARPQAVWLQIWLEQVPDPDSRVTLDEATDSLGLRRARVNWKVADTELETSRRLTNWIADDLSRLGLARLRLLAPMTDDQAWRDAVTDAFHPAGTTRMAADPADGVVDTNLEVHGVRDLYVVGGSVFPIAGYANPTLTIVALAIRLADRLGAPVASGR